MVHQVGKNKEKHSKMCGSHAHAPDSFYLCATPSAYTSTSAAHASQCVLHVPTICSKYYVPFAQNYLHHSLKTLYTNTPILCSNRTTQLCSNFAVKASMMSSHKTNHLTRYTQIAHCARHFVHCARLFVPVALPQFLWQQMLPAAPAGQASAHAQAQFQRPESVTE